MVKSEEIGKHAPKVHLLETRSTIVNLLIEGLLWP
jgi:hypothetical protein